MQTKKISPETLELAVDILKSGGLVAIPTETVYGLAANALDPTAVSKIFKAKGRPSDNPLIVHISEIGQIEKLIVRSNPVAEKLQRAFWPGPLTIILPKSKNIPDQVSAGLDTVAIRMPANEVTQRLITLCGFPLAAPSANLSGRPSPTCAQHVFNDLDGKIDAVINDGPCKVGLESTVITLCGDVPKLLRPGKITVEEIESEIGEIQLDNSIFKELDKTVVASSPGMKYRHYAPKCQIIMITGSSSQYVKYVNSNVDQATAALCFDEEKNSLNCKCISYGPILDFEKQSMLLFDSLRALDDLNIKKVFAHCCRPKGQGMAIYNRLIRAAAFNIIDLTENVNEN